MGDDEDDWCVLATDQDLKDAYGFMGQTGVDSPKHIKLYMVSPNAPDGKMLHSIRPGILRQEISTMTSAESFYPSDVGNKLRLKYKDDTEEWCTLGGDADLDECRAVNCQTGTI